jgi:hypothetical protein
MSTTEGLKPIDNATQLSADPNVRVPDHVRAAAAAADALHKQVYTAPEPAPAAPSTAPTPEQIEAERAAQEANAVRQMEQQPAPAPTEQHPAPSAADQDVTAEEWRHRFLSMQGRFNAAQRTIGSMEEQMKQIGQELVHTQNMLAQQQPTPTATHQDHGNLITDEDRANYGDELIDLARRSALSAVTPELEQLRAENQRLTARVQTTSKRELFATLDGAVPNWRAINVSPEFKLWLRLPNIYTNQLRGKMLKDAVDGADAPKVTALFRDFLTEAAATGRQVPSAQIEQPPPTAAPRTPALDLDTLAAPGRARPASGDSQVPSEKPIYSRADISRFYDEKRRGLWAGREADAVAFENDLTAAQREGRIR